MPINILYAFENEPPPLDFVLPGFLAGTVGTLVGPGATGKSYWALEAAMSIACSVAGGDVLELNPHKTGRVIYLAGEDSETSLLDRLHIIGKYLGPSARKSIADNLVLESIMGKGFNIMNESDMQWLEEFCQGGRLIVLDTLSRIHHLDENSNSQMAQLVSRMEHVVARTGSALLYVHHVNKESNKEGLSDQQHAARGASSLTDNARWCGYLATMTAKQARHLSDRPKDRKAIGDERAETFVRFGVSKQNYSKKPTQQWYERKENGELIPVQLFPAKYRNSKVERGMNDYAG